MYDVRCEGMDGVDTVAGEESVWMEEGRVYPGYKDEWIGME